MEDGRRRLAYVNGGLLERPGFNGGGLAFKHRRPVLQRRRTMVGARVHGFRRRYKPGGDEIAAGAGDDSFSGTIRFPFFREKTSRGELACWPVGRDGVNCKNTRAHQGAGGRLFANEQPPLQSLWI
jgi:hypothetical protein